MRIGLQGYKDNNDFALILGDMAGVKLSSKFDNVSGNVAWFKLAEGDGGSNHTVGTADSEDDATLIAAQLNFKPSEALTLNTDLYYAKNQGTTLMPILSVEGTKEDLYYLSLSGKYKMPAMTITGWTYYNFGTSENAADDGGDVDISALAASVKCAIKAGDSTIGLRAIYFSGDDDSTDNDRSAIRLPWADGVPVGMSVPFPGTGLMILLPDQFGTTYHTGYGHAMTDAAFDQYGLGGIVANVMYKPQSMKSLWLKGSAGIFQALEDDQKSAGSKREGKSIGTEVAARAGYSFGKFEVSLNGAYAFLGDFYDKTLAGGEDPDNQYQTYLMAQYSF